MIGCEKLTRPHTKLIIHFAILNNKGSHIRMKYTLSKMKEWLRELQSEMFNHGFIMTTPINHYN